VGWASARQGSATSNVFASSCFVDEYGRFLSGAASLYHANIGPSVLGIAANCCSKVLHLRPEVLSGPIVLTTSFAPSIMEVDTSIIFSENNTVIFRDVNIIYKMDKDLFHGFLIFVYQFIYK
jgi:hypothetical protein